MTGMYQRLKRWRSDKTMGQMLDEVLALNDRLLGDLETMARTQDDLFERLRRAEGIADIATKRLQVHFAKMTNLISRVNQLEDTVRQLVGEGNVHELRAVVPRGMQVWQDDIGNSLVVHGQSNCLPPCPVHAPSNHHMRNWPRQWSKGDGMKRICVHRLPHPDPDDLHERIRPGAHPCDGCCNSMGGDDD